MSGPTREDRELWAAHEDVMEHRRTMPWGIVFTVLFWFLWAVDMPRLVIGLLACWTVLCVAVAASWVIAESRYKTLRDNRNKREGQS